MESIPLIPIGSSIKIDTLKIEERISKELFLEIAENPKGVIVDYKMTDGNGIGYVIKVNNGSKLWVFTYEIATEALQKYNLSDPNLTDIDKINANLMPSFLKQYINNVNDGIENSGDKDITFMLNPLNFIKWLLYSTKDIF